MHETLTKHAATVWVQQFHSDTLNIHEVVETTVPRLLSKETIRAIRAEVPGLVVATRLNVYDGIPYHGGPADGRGTPPARQRAAGRPG